MTIPINCITKFVLTSSLLCTRLFVGKLLLTKTKVVPRSCLFFDKFPLSRKVFRLCVCVCVCLRRWKEHAVIAKAMPRHAMPARAASFHFPSSGLFASMEKRIILVVQHTVHYIFATCYTLIFISPECNNSNLSHYCMNRMRVPRFISLWFLLSKQSVVIMKMNFVCYLLLKCRFSLHFEKCVRICSNNKKWARASQQKEREISYKALICRTFPLNGR